MIESFKDSGVEDIYNGDNTKNARKACPETIWKITIRKLEQLNAATELNDLKVPPANRLEALKGDREGQYSIRINDQYRICFEWSDDSAENVEIVDYH